MNQMRLSLVGLLKGLIPESRGFGVKRALYRWAGARIGSDVRIYSSARIMGVGELVIGDDVHIGAEVLIYTNKGGRVTVGSHVDIAPRVVLHTGSHKVDPTGAHVAGEGTAGDIAIGEGSWIGVNATVLAGVELKSRTLVAAGSVVTRSPVQGNCLLAGVPAQVKKSLV